MSMAKSPRHSETNLVAKRWHVHTQAWEARQAAISSFRACGVSALQAGEMATAVATAEQIVACLGNADGQKAAEALLMAQSCRAVTDLEALYQSAAGPQASIHLALHAPCFVGFLVQMLRLCETLLTGYGPCVDGAP